MKTKAPPLQLTLTKHPPGSEGFCHFYTDKWFKYFIHELPPVVALLEVSPTDYFTVVNAKTRNMVRKAVSNGYQFRKFKYNDELKAMYEINTSIKERQDRPMSSSYYQELAPIVEEDPPNCIRHVQVYCGVFDKDNNLVAYCWLACCEDVAIINRILGHADFQQYGIMNLMFYGLYYYCAANSIKYINYRAMESSTDGLQAFKKHVGFKSVYSEVVR